MTSRSAAGDPVWIRLTQLQRTILQQLIAVSRHPSPGTTRRVVRAILAAQFRLDDSGVVLVQQAEQLELFGVTPARQFLPLAPTLPEEQQEFFSDPYSLKLLAAAPCRLQLQPAACVVQVRQSHTWSEILQVPLPPAACCQVYHPSS